MLGEQLRGYTAKSLIIVLIIGSIFITPLQLLSANQIDIQAGVAVFYDSESSTALKTEKLLSELIIPHGARVENIPVASEREFLSRVSNLVATDRFIVLIGHGSWTGIQFGQETVRWETVRGTLAGSMSPKIILLSCYSSIVPLGLPEDRRDAWFGLDGRVDYLIGAYAAAAEIARTLDSKRLFNHLQQSAAAIEDEFFKRAAYALEPLWSKTSHDKLAELSLYYEVSSLWSSLNSVTRGWADEPKRADEVDKTDNAEMVDILLDSGRRNLWLKHNYGNRFGFRVYTYFDITIWQLSMLKGTAHTSAQSAFDSAVSCYLANDFINAGKQLSYAVHYGQDMTMPFHIYDYVKINHFVRDPLSALAAVLIIVDLMQDYYALDHHKNMESWVYNKWDTYISGSTLKNDVKNAAASTSFLIGTGSTEVRDAVAYIAQWTRGQMSRSTAESFNGKSNSEKKALATPLLAKAVDLSTALYNLFIDRTLLNPEVLTSSYITQVVERDEILAYSKMRFEINKADYYHIKVEYRYKRSGTWSSWRTDRWTQSYYTLGTWSITDYLYCGRDGDLVEVKWSIYDRTGTTRLDTYSETFMLNGS